MKRTPYGFKIRHTYKLKKTNEQNKDFSNSSIVIQYKFITTNLDVGKKDCMQQRRDGWKWSEHAACATSTMHGILE